MDKNLAENLKAHLVLQLQLAEKANAILQKSTLKSRLLLQSKGLDSFSDDERETLESLTTPICKGS
jgi:hypothetical protein